MKLTKKQTAYLRLLSKTSDKLQATSIFSSLNNLKEIKKLKEFKKFNKKYKEFCRTYDKKEKEILKPKEIIHKDTSSVKEYLKNHFGMSVLDEQAEKLLIFTHNIHKNGIKNIDVVSEIIE